MGQVVERWDDQTFRQVAGGTENHHRARRRGRGALILLSAFGLDELIVLAQCRCPVFCSPIVLLKFRVVLASSRRQASYVRAIPLHRRRHGSARSRTSVAV